MILEVFKVIFLNYILGKFYVVNAEYMLRSGFMTPYQITWYHLK
jgi:hypothetical protein